jgi:hypothetical protein
VIAIFILVRSLTEGALDLGRDFLLLSTVAFSAESWLIVKERELKANPIRR